MVWEMCSAITASPSKTQPMPGCKRCGKPVPRGSRVYCDDCLPHYQREILPLIHVPLSRLQRATGLSLRYVSMIRRGERAPHPRHWRAFTEAGTAPAD